MPKQPKQHTGKPETTEVVSDQEERLTVTFVSAEVPAIYSNFVQLTVTPFDIGLRFAQLAYDSPKPTAREVARVVVSPQTAKAILRLLERQIRDYEKNYGEIPEVIKTTDDITRVRP
ncbi:MAG TPA: DUF3467 domain-containing protein [Thermoanaerobaculia bacterium]|nr:DUF3467 domain-containing protein [Thermoanaerobaculia bacterium]